MLVGVALVAPEKPRVPKVRAAKRSVVKAYSVSVVPVDVMAKDVDTRPVICSLFLSITTPRGPSKALAVFTPN